MVSCLGWPSSIQTTQIQKILLHKPLEKEILALELKYTEVKDILEIQETYPQDPLVGPKALCFRKCSFSLSLIHCLTYKTCTHYLEKPRSPWPLALESSPSYARI